MTRTLPRYAELLGLMRDLPVAVREARRRDGLTLRDLSAQSGVALNTLSRFERGLGDVQLATVIALVTWLDQPKGQHECVDP